MSRRPRPEIVCNPEIMGGDPTIYGTRVPAEIVLVYIEAGDSEATLLDHYPYLPAGTMAAVESWARAVGRIVDTTPERPWRRFART